MTFNRFQNKNDTLILRIYCQRSQKCQTKRKNKTPEKSHKKNTGNNSHIFSLIGYL